MIQIRDSYRAPGTVRVTWWLLYINLISFLSATYGGALTNLHSLGTIVAMGGVVPAEFYDPSLLDAKLQAYRLSPFLSIIWYQFLHGGWLHLLSNSLVLMVLGPNVEKYMGRGRFLMFYLTCGSVGALFQVLFTLKSSALIIGASGATSGLLGAYFCVFPANYIRITFGSVRGGNYRDLMLPIKALLAFYAASQIMDALIPTVLPKQNVAYLTHLGGFVAGYFLAKGRGSIGSGRRNFKVFMGGKAHGGGLS